MAEGFLKEFDKNLVVFSAGTNPSHEVHPKAIEVMHEVGIDLTQNKPESVDNYLNNSFDYVITVCGGAKETCPTFMGDVKNKLHIGFEDPADAEGTEEEITMEFRKIRNDIERDFINFYNKELKVS
jgi:arsenate reductase